MKIRILMGFAAILGFTGTSFAAPMAPSPCTTGYVTNGDFCVKEGPHGSGDRIPGQEEVIWESSSTATQSVDASNLYDELSSFGITSADILVFGFNANESGGDQGLSITSLSITFGDIGAASLSSGLAFISTDGNSTLDYLFEVDLDMDFMSVFNTGSTCSTTAGCITTSIGIALGSNGKESFWLDFGRTATANPGDDGDEDLDGVPDSIDQCPNTPFGTQVDTVGCPVMDPPDDDDDDTTPIPEPGTLALMGLGLVGFGFSRRRITKKS